MKKNLKRLNFKRIAAAFLCVILVSMLSFTLVSCSSGVSTGEASGASVQQTDTDTDSQTPGDTEGDSEDNADTENVGKTENTKETKITVFDRSGGFLGFLYRWFGTALSWLYGVFKNYIVAILVFALVVKLILFPLSIKQQKNSQKMAKLAPKTEAIRKKYAGRTDKATQMKMNEEIQQLYSEEKFNPMGGCLPMLLQLPIIIALYNAITNPLSSVYNYTSEKLAELSSIFTNNAHLFNDAAGKLTINTTLTEANAISAVASAQAGSPIANAFGQYYTEFSEFYQSFQIAPKFNLMDNPQFASWLVIVPVLVFLSSFFSTKIIRKFTYNPNGNQQDASMKIMDWTMPLMILWFSFSVPALVGIYWIFQNIISIGQQYALYKLFPVKAPTPEEIREAELLMRGKKPKNVVYEDDRPEKPARKTQVQKAALKKKKANSPFIYAKKGIAEKYLVRIKEKGVTPKAKNRP